MLEKVGGLTESHVASVNYLKSHQNVWQKSTNSTKMGLFLAVTRLCPFGQEANTQSVAIEHQGERSIW